MESTYNCVTKEGANVPSFYFKKEDSARKTELVELLNTRKHALEEAIGTFNDAMAEAFEAVEKAIDSYNEAIDEAKTFPAETAGGIQEHIDSKSERWSETDRGIAFKEWFDSWNDIGNRLEAQLSILHTYLHHA